MDSFDTILEHLKLAQDRGKRAVDGRVETIAGRLNQLVEEATASVRETMACEAEELFPAADLKLALEELQSRISEIEREKVDLAQELDWAQSRLAGVQAEGSAEAEVDETTGGPSLELLRGLDQARSQSDLLKALLPALCDFVARAVVMVIRGGEVSAWSGIGFADGESLRHWQTTVPASPAIHALVSESRPVNFRAEGDKVFEDWLAAEGLPGHALLVPVCLRGQLMGFLYLDDGVDGPWDPDSAQGLVAVACWMIDTLQARQELPSPMIAEPLVLEIEPDGAVESEDIVPALEDVGVEIPDDTEVEAIEEADLEPETDEVPVVEEPEFSATPEPDDYGEIEEIEEVEAPGPAIQDFDPSETMRIEVPPESVEEFGVEETEPEPEPEVEAVPEPDAEVEPEPEPDAEVEPEPEPEPEPEAEEPPKSAEVVPPSSAAVVPPPPLEPAAQEPIESGRSSDEQARHEEARRFARLLISEIKLYNEEEVERGCAGKDLYQRLYDDIDRSREMYEKRIGEDIRSETDYFRDEMIRILADGDEDALGM